MTEVDSTMKLCVILIFLNDLYFFIMALVFLEENLDNIQQLMQILLEKLTLLQNFIYLIYF